MSIFYKKEKNVEPNKVNKDVDKTYRMLQFLSEDNPEVFERFETWITNNIEQEFNNIFNEEIFKNSVEKIDGQAIVDALVMYVVKYIIENSDYLVENIGEAILSNNDIKDSLYQKIGREILTNLKPFYNTNKEAESDE